MSKVFQLEWEKFQDKKQEFFYKTRTIKNRQKSQHQLNPENTDIKYKFSSKTRQNIYFIRCSRNSHTPTNNPHEQYLPNLQYSTGLLKGNHTKEWFGKDGPPKRIIIAMRTRNEMLSKYNKRGNELHEKQRRTNKNHH